ncbi:MAG: serine hydroxymethyltransferase, partial [Amylibacter sp.]
ANFDAAKSAALAVGMLDWREFGADYATEMIAVAQAFAQALDAEGLPVFAKGQGFTQSHQFALEAAWFGGGQAASKKLRKAGFLACGIGLPIDPVAGDMNGLRFGTPELVRWGVTADRVDEIAALVARALRSNDPESVADEVRKLRGEFRSLCYVFKD